MKNLVEHVLLLGLLLFRWKLGLWGPPLGVKQLCKINECEAGTSTSSASEVENDSGLHGGEKRVARACSSVIHKVGLIDTTIGGLGGGFADDPRPELGNSVIVEMRRNRTSRPCPSLSRHYGKQQSLNRIYDHRE